MSAVSPPLAPLSPARSRRKPARRGKPMFPKPRCRPQQFIPDVVLGTGPLPPPERRALREIIKSMDVIGEAGGAVFLLVQLKPGMVETLAAFEASLDDLEPEDGEGDDINGAPQDQMGNCDGDTWIEAYVRTAWGT